MSVLDVQNVSRAYGDRVVLDGVSFTLTRGERMGIVGVNGAGKSTLARIVAGIEEPDSGERVLRRGAVVGYLPQQPVFEGNPTARDAAMAGMARWRAAIERHEAISIQLADDGADYEALLARQAEAAEEVERLGGWSRDADVDAMLHRVAAPEPDRHVDSMSGGERRRVDLARLLVARPDVMILDEPTNHLDVETIEWLEVHLQREQPGALLVITHDRYFLDRVVQRTAEIDAGRLHLYEGGYRAYLEAKADRLAHAERVERNRQNFLRTELEWLRRSPKARTTKSKSRVARAEAARDAGGPRRERAVRLELDAEKSGRTILELHDASIELAGRTLVKDFSIHLTKGERIGIVGPNGAGKTTLLRAVLGEVPLASGRRVVGARTNMTYLGQRREGLDESATILENVSGGASQVDLGSRRISAHAYLERFLFDGGQQRQPVSALSGGEKARVLLAKLLLKPTNLLILDEPTNDLDVMTLGALEELLIEMGTAALVVTHDRYFLDRIATSILAFEGEGRLVRYVGDYTTYLSLKANAPKEEAEEKPEAKKPPKPATKKPKKELERVMKEIETVEARIAELEATLGDPATYADGADTSALVDELASSREALEGLMAKWESLEDPGPARA